MAWTCTVESDPDKDNVGEASAVWNGGMADEFVYSRRGKFTLVEANAFVSEARAARDAAATKVTTNASLTALLQGRFDAAEGLQ